jgi:hypothetical protein
MLHYRRRRQWKHKRDAALTICLMLKLASLTLLPLLVLRTLGAIYVIRVHLLVLLLLFLRLLFPV